MFNKYPKKRWLGFLIMISAFFIQSLVIADDRDDDDDKNNIVAGIISAPVVMNGIVANEPTEFNLIFNASGVGLKRALDPQVFGFQIPAGGRMEIELSEEFKRNTRINPDSGLSEPVPIKPNANIILTTGPQNPIIFQSGNTVARGNWNVSDNGRNLITITPLGGSGNNGLENARANEIGMKVIHIRPNPRSVDGMPFINGDAGDEGEVEVRIYNAANQLIADGEGEVTFKASVGRQISNTNDGLRTTPGGSPAVETIESINFQRVATGTELTNTTKTTPFSAGYPYAPRFILFEALNPDVRGQFTTESFIPQAGLEGVTYEVSSKKPWRAKLFIYNTAGKKETVGVIVISGPKKKDRGRILPPVATTILGGNGSILSVPVKVGSAAGSYKVKVSLEDGGKTVTTIIAE